MRALLLAALPLVSLALVPACADSSSDDELAGEADSEDNLGGKTDSPDGVYTYFEISADLRKCLAPMCGGYFLDRLNATTTKCHDGTYKAACYAPVLDWSEANLGPVAQGKLADAANNVGPGVYAIVRGRFAKKNTTTPQPNLGKFIVTEAWVADGEGVSDGVFAKVANNHIECIVAPCPTVTERALNSSRTANIAEIDWSAGGFSDSATQRLVDDMAKPGGVILAGDRYALAHSGKGRTATNAYRNLANAPAQAACYVGGCSGQVCSDHPGVITTCEARPSYGCYHTATCERQTDGDCGWTETPELQACLANAPF